MKQVLNVGGGDRSIELPGRYGGWQADLLDIDPRVGPDILLDARQLHTLPAQTYDAIYCSHNLEHYHRHEVLIVVEGFAHVLKSGGFVEVRVPDIMMVMQEVVRRGLDIDDVLYSAPGGPVLVRDVIYGWHLPIERGNDFYAHKTAFSRKALQMVFARCGFAHAVTGSECAYDMTGYFFRQAPPPEFLRELGIEGAG